MLAVSGKGSLSPRRVAPDTVTTGITLPLRDSGMVRPCRYGRPLAVSTPSSADGRLTLHSCLIVLELAQAMTSVPQRARGASLGG